MFKYTDRLWGQRIMARRQLELHRMGITARDLSDHRRYQTLSGFYPPPLKIYDF